MRQTKTANVFNEKNHSSLAYEAGIVFEGEIILRLDNGDSRTLKKGDVVVQRG